MYLPFSGNEYMFAYLIEATAKIGFTFFAFRHKSINHTLCSTHMTSE